MDLKTHPKKHTEKTGWMDIFDRIFIITNVNSYINWKVIDNDRYNRLFNGIKDNNFIYLLLKRWLWCGYGWKKTSDVI
jgi:hypothetical protein